MYVSGKMKHVETTAGIGGEGGIKKNDGGREFKYDVFNLL
jgi:hypothetical protein